MWRAICSGLADMGGAFLAFGVLSCIAYYEGSTLLLRAAGGKAIDKKHAPELFNVVEEVSIAAGLSTIPQVYIIKSDIPNAFATCHCGAKVPIPSNVSSILDLQCPNFHQPVYSG